jgi:Transglycosylase SLT domain
VNILGSTLLAQHQQAKAKWPFIETIEKDHSLPAWLLYAVGSRETNLRNIKGDFSQRPGESSPRYHGFGVWQRDSGTWHVGESYLQDVRKQAKDAAELLAANHRTFDQWDAAVAAYNCGPGNVRKAIDQGLSLDHFTTGRDYSADVLARRAYLVAHVTGEAEDLSITDGRTEDYLDGQFSRVLGRLDLIRRGDLQDPATGNTHPNNLDSILDRINGIERDIDRIKQQLQISG